MTQGQAPRRETSAAQAAASPPRALYLRHLGVPQGVELDGAAAALADRALAWYRARGTPWTRVAIRRLREIQGDRIFLENGPALASAAIAAGFREAGVHAVAIVGSSAGSAVDDEVDRLWREGRPDEAMFLSALAVAVAEHLRDCAAARIGAEQARAGVTALPRYSPGYEGWGLADQAALVAAIDDAGPLRVLPSGGLVPQKSTVAAIGLTRRRDLGAMLETIWCGLRRNGAPGAEVRYTVPERVLSRWSRERLGITKAPEGRLLARFRFDGRSCTSLGRPFAVDYEVELEAEAPGRHRIAALACGEAAGDSGLRFTCAFQAGAERFARALREAPPLVGERLDAALAGSPCESPSACLCTAASRNHKWRIVLQTVHHAISRLEGGAPEHDIEG